MAETGIEGSGRLRRPLRLALPRACKRPAPSREQARYLRSGLGQPGLKLPLFDGHGRPVGPRTIEACVDRGWAEPWFEAPRAKGWRVCRLTNRGAEALNGAPT